MPNKIFCTRAKSFIRKDLIIHPIAAMKAVSKANWNSVSKEEKRLFVIAFPLITISFATPVRRTLESSSDKSILFPLILISSLSKEIFLSPNFKLAFILSVLKA